MIKVSE